MNLIVIIVIGAVLIGLSFRKLPMLFWMATWMVAVYCFVRFGFTKPVPVSVLKIYMSITAVGVLAYLYADEARLKETGAQVLAFLLDTRFRLLRNAVFVILPLLLATKIYFDMNQEVQAATFGRTVHPPPPNTIKFKGKEIDLISGKNPYRELEKTSVEDFRKHVANGKRVYYQNCVYCHGDDMNGDGIYAHAFSPIPANFNSPTTIAMLQESYLFWRIAKGGPGLPDEAGPWSSSMPAWEQFLTEEEIWDVILYLYDYTGQNPRAEEEHH